jgi:UDP-N-acetylmuramoyl-tripeptide--D-alanyl-D-alanine ligase
MLRYEELPDLIPCRLYPARLSGVIQGHSFDSRTLRRGELFWALRGEKADGHEFLESAFAAGAAAAVVSGKWFHTAGGRFPRGAFVIVDDPLQALQAAARAHRKRFDIPVIALTGSNGKTSTKELLAAALAEKYRLLKSEGNFNNHIGVPLTLLKISAETELVLTEMGTNHPGEIAALCAIARPTAGLVLNVGPAHLEGFGNIAGVAREKESLLTSLPADGAAFLNLDDARVRRMQSTARRKIGFGFRPAAAALREGFAQIIRARRHGGAGAFQIERTVFKLNWPGMHQQANALAAAVVAYDFGVPWEASARRFAQMPPLSGRMEVRTIAGVTILDDTYNANPASTAAALETLNALPVQGRRIVVLGDHLELGKCSKRLHRRLAAEVLGTLFRSDDRAEVFLIGAQMRAAYDVMQPSGKQAFYFPDGTDIERITGEIYKALSPGDAILFKASRGMALDRIVRRLERMLTETKPTGRR